MNKSGTPQTRRTRIWKSLRTIAVMLLTLLIIVRVTGVAEKLAYWPTRDTPPTPSAYQDVWISTPDGVTLHAWFMPAINVAPDERAPAVLHVHGNAGNIGHHESFSSFLTNHGMHVLLFDYRCYGKSDETGSLSRERLGIDTNAALDALLDHPRVDPDRVGVLGVSLGGPFAMNTAANEPRVRAVATLSTFSSWSGVASDMSPLAPLLFPSGDPAYDPIKAVNALNNRPYLILHGDNDQIVSPRHADLLYEQATNASVDATLARYPGDHNTLVQTNLHARNELVEFLSTHLNVTEEHGMIFRSKNTTPEEKFWSWFSKNQEHLLELDIHAMTEAVADKLHQYNDGLAVVIGRAKNEPNEILISADGMSELVDVVEQLCDAAPELPNWKITRFRPRLDIDRYQIRYQGTELDIDAIQYIAYHQESRIGIKVYAHWRSSENGIEPDYQTFLLLDHTIGEYEVMCGIGFIEVHPLENAPENARPWSEFAEMFDENWVREP